MRQASRWMMLMLLLSIAPFTGCRRAGQPSLADARQAITNLVEVNRYWLLEVPAAVSNYTYVLNRSAGSRRVEVTDPLATPPPRRWGVTYASILQHVTRSFPNVNITRVEKVPAGLRVELAFVPQLEGAVGNGIENSWTGYHTLGGTNGYVILDPQRWVPLEAGVGRVKEAYSEFVSLGANHYAPLTIRLDVGETSYDWKFRVHEPGLWLFEEANSNSRKLAWVDQVKVNGALAKVVAAAASEREEEQADRRARARLRQFLGANIHWLLPPLESRAGLIYEYRQEPPYCERIYFHPEGHVLAQLQSSKASPEEPTTQQFWLADGRSGGTSVGNPFVGLNPMPADALWRAAYWPHKDRVVQHLLTGLAVENVLTRLAREPESFWAEAQDSGEHPDRYVLVLRPKSGARLFAGTMLAFSSWAYMHDLPYDRAEVLVEAATHRPLEAHHYFTDLLRGSFWFERWTDAAAEGAPSLIRALIPHAPEGKDQALEMTARFGPTGTGAWLLQSVESRFRNTESKSTGTLTVVTPADNAFAPVEDVIAKTRFTWETLPAIANTAHTQPAADLTPGASTNYPLLARWERAALEAARAQMGVPNYEPLIGTYQLALSTNASILRIHAVSAVPWMEFASSWRLALVARTAGGNASHSIETNLNIRAEGGPAGFVLDVPLPAEISTPGDALQNLNVAVEVRIEKLTAMRRGSGHWFRFTSE